MEVRLLLAFLLMGAVMFLTPYFYKSPPPTKKTNPPAASLPQQQPAPESAAVAAKEPKEPVAPATAEQQQPHFVINNGVYRIEFSNQGAIVRSWQLSKYRGNDNKPLEIVNTAASAEPPVSLYFPGEKPTINVNQALYKQTPEADGLGVAYEFSDGHTSVRKTFRFQKDSYRSQVSAEVTVDGRPIASMIQWRGGFGDLTVASPAVHTVAVYFNPAEDKLVEQAAKSAKNGPVSSTGSYSFAGIVDQYFAAVFLPENNRNVTAVTFSDDVPTALEQKSQAFAGAASAQ